MCADEWKNGSADDAVQGTTNLSDLDTNISNYLQNPLDRLLANYRNGCQVLYGSAKTVTVGAGEISTVNSGSTVLKMRANTSAITLTLDGADTGSNKLDTGTEANSTQYYVYAVADADATSFTGFISVSASAPTGATHYRRVGYFYNDSSGNITDVGNDKNGNVDNLMVKTGSTDISLNTTTAELMDDMACRFISSGGLVQISFVAQSDSNTGYGAPLIYVDSSDKTGEMHACDSNASGGFSAQWAEVLSAGAHLIEIYWVCGHSSYTINQNGSTKGKRVLIIRES